MNPLKLKDLSDEKVREVCEQTYANILQLDDGINYRLTELEQSLEFVLSALSLGNGTVVPEGIIASIENIANKAAEEYKGFKKRQQQLNTMEVNHDN